MIIGIIAISLILYVFVMLYLHDAILQIMYDRYRKDWIKVGKPLGSLFFIPDGFAAYLDIRRLRASRNFQYRLLFWAPDSLREDDRGIRLLWIYRLLVLLAPLLLILLFLYEI